jgi:hypothetical protein
MKTGFKLIIALLSGMLVSVPFSIAQEEKWDNAPKVVPRTTKTMQTPEFWMNRIQNPDTVVMTPQQIAQMNARNRKLPPTIKDINGEDYSINNVIESKLGIGLQFNVEEPLKMKSIPGDSLRAMLQRHKDLLTRETWYERRQMKYDKDVIDAFIDNMNIPGVPENIVPKYGILVKQTLNRAVPTNQAGYGNPRSWLDGFQSTSLDLAMPVAILHASKDRTWLYVRSEIAFGWVPAENVAIGSAQELQQYDDSKNILVTLEYNVPVHGDRNFETFIVNLFIGSKVKLIKNSASGYTVLIPFRKPDGSFTTVEGWIKKNAKVSVGYQPFTQRNVISTMFNMLYRPYAWADSDHEYDCCGTVRVVLRTFGIKTGRWTSFELHSTPHVTAFNRKTATEKKYELLKGREPGITLVGNNGHICMYLGEVEGRHYVIHQGGYSYKGEDGVTYHFRRVNVNDTELEGGSNIAGWTEISTIKP